MLALLVAAGIIPLQIDAGSGAFDVAPERIATPAKLQAETLLSAGIPYGATPWPWPFDPADEAPYGMSFDNQLDAGETIADILSISLSSAAAALGLTIDVSTGRAPLIDADGQRRVQLWFTVASAQQGSPSYDAAGVRLPVAFRVRTSKGRRFRRSAVLTVRNL